MKIEYVRRTTTHLMDKATASVHHPSSTFFFFFFFFFFELATKFKARDINVIVARQRIYSSSGSGGVNSLFSPNFQDLYGKIK